jgi:hypothetical protein
MIGLMSKLLGIRRRPEDDYEVYNMPTCCIPEEAMNATVTVLFACLTEKIIW